MTSIRYTDPKLSGIYWNLHPIDNHNYSANPTGVQNPSINRQKEGLSVEFMLYLDDVQTGKHEYSFGKDDDVDETMKESTVLSNAGADVAAAWETALDAIVDADPTDIDTGPPVYLRVDSWKVKLGDGPRSIQAIIGVYSDNTYVLGSRMSYQSVWFGDSRARDLRTNSLANIQTQIDAETVIVDAVIGDYPEMTEEQFDEHQAGALARRVRHQEQKDRLNAETVLNMEDLLSDAGLQTSIGQLMTGVFTTLIDEVTIPEWDGVSLATVMTSFQDSFTALLAG